MKKNTIKVTLRINQSDKELLENLAVESGLSINQTIINLIQKSGQEFDVKAELFDVKKNLITLQDLANKQTAVIADIGMHIKNRG